jgi:hypothetical protein
MLQKVMTREELTAYKLGTHSATTAARSKFKIPTMLYFINVTNLDAPEFARAVG